jgi:hypothetical protein
VYRLVQKRACEDERSRYNFSKCQDLTAEACDDHKLSISQICRDDRDTPLAVPLDCNKKAKYVL